MKIVTNKSINTQKLIDEANTLKSPYLNELPIHDIFRCMLFNCMPSQLTKELLI